MQVEADSLFPIINDSERMGTVEMRSVDINEAAATILQYVL